MTIARVYEYGLLPPTANAPLVDDQIRAAHRYRNLLVEIERARREEVRAILSRHPDTEALALDVERIAAEREDLRSRIKRGNAEERKRVPQVELRGSVREVSGRLREARLRFKAAKAQIAADPEVRAAIDAADERAAARVRQERGRCGVYWSTYLLQEADADRARKEKTPPKFRRFTGEGRVAVQLQGGIELGDLWGTDTQIQVLRVADDRTSRRARIRQRGILKMRVQSDERGKPVWAEWPMIMHRPLPESSRIKSAVVHKRRRDCRDWTWTVTIQVELPDEWTLGTCGEDAVALNLGYTASYEHLRGAVRSGYLVDEVGYEREVAVAKSVIDRVEKSESIRSIRDKNLDQMRADLVVWLREHEAELPEWLVERTILSKRRPAEGEQETAARRPEARDEERSTIDGAETTVETTEVAQSFEDRDSASTIRTWHVALWRSASRFRALALSWREQRWLGDAEQRQPGEAGGYDLIEAWRYRDEHLQKYEAGLLRGALLDRREKYRILAAELATTYRILVVGSTDLRTLQRSPAPEDDRGEIAVVKRNQRHAAGSVLRSALVNAFKRRGGQVVVVDDDKATITCHACGNIEEWDRISDRRHTCSSCSTTWDQDENHCKNLLARWRRERELAVVDPATSRAAKGAEKKESRSERLRRTRWSQRGAEVAREG
jgi:putative transposase-like DNA-binding protein